MEKVSVAPANLFCPQTLFLYGTYREDGTPNFGLFCWMSYYWDGGVGVMACIGEEKLTKDRIRETGVFSANLVTEPLLPLADYVGNTSSYQSPHKMKIPVETERGLALPVPILKDSPWVFELEVDKTIPLDGGHSDVFLCKIRGTQIAKELADDTLSVEERMRRVAPVSWIGQGSYFSLNPAPIGFNGDWKSAFPQK